MMLTIKNKIEEVENFMLSLPQEDCPVRHIFGDGIYIREVSFKADTWAIGHHQNFEHMNIFIKGKVKMYNEDGTYTILEAPMTFIGKPGRKIGYIIEDTIWQNVYSTCEQNINKLEDKYLTKSQEFKTKIESEQNILDNSDYKLLLLQMNISEDKVKEEVEDLSDHIDLPNGIYNFELQSSSIEGLGIFASCDIKAETLIGPARIDGKRTILGRRVNHSLSPNAMMIPNGEDLSLWSISDIKGKKGGFNGEEITIDYRFTITMQQRNKLLKEHIICLQSQQQ